MLKVFAHWRLYLLCSLAICIAIAVLCFDLTSEAAPEGFSGQRRPWTKELLMQRIEYFKNEAVSANRSEVRDFALMEQARCEMLLDRRAEAVETLTSAIKIGSDDASIVSAKGMLAALYFRNGEIADGERVLSSIEASGSENDEVLIAMAERSRVARDFTGSIELFRQAAALRAERKDTIGEAECLLEVGFDLMTSIRPLEAVEVLRHVQELFATQKDDRGLALTLIALGHTYSALSNPGAALDAYREAERIFPPEVDYVNRGSLLSGISHVYEEIGDLETAANLREQAISLFEKAGSDFDTLINHARLARTKALMGENQQAVEYFAAADRIAADLGDEYTRNLNKVWLAEAQIVAGHLEAANQALAAADAYFRPRHLLREVSMIERLYGIYHFSAGRPDQAYVKFSRALDLCKQLQDDLTAADIEFRLAQIETNRGDRTSAIRRLVASVETGGEVASSLLNSRIRRSFLSKTSDRYALLIQITLDGTGGESNDTASALTLVERMRSRTLVEAIGIRGLNADEQNIDNQRLREVVFSLNASKDELQSIISRNAESSEIQSAENKVLLLSREFDEVLADEKANIFGLQNLNRAALGADDLAALLQNDDLLIEFFFSETKSYVWVISSTALAAYELPSRKLIEKQIERLEELMNARKPQPNENFADRQARVAQADLEYLALARAVSNMILGPVAEKIKGKRLIVVPDGKLNYFPISALPMPNSESDDPILLTNEVIYQPSAQTYALLKKIGQERKDERTKDLLVFSDPVFNPADERLTGIEVAAEKPDEQQYRFRLVESFSSLSRLPASKTEAETVSSAVGGSDLFMGFDATRDRLLNTNLSDYRVVHLATHGFLDPERPELSSLVFSRYDQTGKQIDESIRMHDIYSMKLNADLVVLSACQTGTGKEIKGEGVMGLNTAFLQAGARSVVSTLWQVEDNAANQLMKEFYGRMVSDGMSPSAALRAAQIKLYQDPQFRSPFFWAAFTVHGDAATATPFKRDHTKLVISISAAVALGLVGFILLRRRRYRTSKV